ncbi:MAG TPA: TolC family protein [Candidatus Acidoferrales bacterium]
MSSRHFLFGLVILLSGLACGNASAQNIVATTPAVQSLTLSEAEKIAVQNHPEIQAAQDVAEAASQQTRQVRSAYYPTAFGSVTGAEAENNSRVAAGALNNPIIFNRYSNGVQVNQLVTDFGRTHELVKSSSLRAKAEEEGIVTSRANVLLRVDRSYYGVLKAQAVLRVAQETVKDRQLVSDQITALAQNKLKSGLDVSFANVDLAQAQLLLVQAQNDLQASYAALADALGYADERVFQLSEVENPAGPPADETTAIRQALRDRPELIGRRLDVSSAQSYVTAERDLWLPTISAVGVAGLTPIHQQDLAPRYAAGGFNVNIPLFNGHLYEALRGEADAQARAQEQYLRAEQNGIVRDVQRAWLDANSGYQRLGLTNQLLEQASKAVELAQARYKLGISSIIELSQAQLNQTQAEIAQASARYDYQAELAALAFQSGQIR